MLCMHRWLSGQSRCTRAVVHGVPVLQSDCYTCRVLFLEPAQSHLDPFRSWVKSQAKASRQRPSPPTKQTVMQRFHLPPREPTLNLLNRTPTSKRRVGPRCFGAVRTGRHHGEAEDLALALRRRAGADQRAEAGGQHPVGHPWLGDSVTR